VKDKNNTFYNLDSSGGLNCTSSIWSFEMEARLRRPRPVVDRRVGGSSCDDNVSASQAVCHERDLEPSNGANGNPANHGSICTSRRGPPYLLE
jgi:hypothetical protein